MPIQLPRFGTPGSVTQRSPFNSTQKAPADVSQMIGGISDKNTEGRAFYLAIGYREVAVIAQAGDKFGRFMDLVLIQKFLT